MFVQTLVEYLILDSKFRRFVDCLIVDFNLKRMKIASLLLLCLSCFLLNTNIYAQQLDTIKIVKQIDSLIGISKNLCKEKKFEEASKIVEQIDAICTSTIGKENFSYAKCLRQKGGVLHFQNKFQEALPFIFFLKTYV